MDTSSTCGVSMQLTLHINGAQVVAELISRKGNRITIAIGGAHYDFLCQRLADGTMVIDQEIAPNVWRRLRGASWLQKGAQQIQLGAHVFSVADAAQGTAATEAAAPLSPRAPMPGLVRQVLVKKGDKVKAGQALAVLEAMKLQLSLTAGGDGVVEAVLVKAGDMVPEGAELVRITP